MRRSLISLLSLPFAAASILAGHAAAYALTGASPGGIHGYLEHAPQVVAVLVLLGLVGLAHAGRARTSSHVPVATLALAGFACQEHLERLAHTGEVPFLLASPTFLLGLALQLPFAAALWLLARRVARTLARVERDGPPRLALLPLLPLPASRLAAAVAVAGCARGRAPPTFS